MIKTMFDSFKAEIKKSHFKILIDSINTDKEMRSHYINLVDKSTTKVVVYYFDYQKEFVIHINQIR
jgi:hypothetical protein